MEDFYLKFLLQKKEICIRFSLLGENVIRRSKPWCKEKKGVCMLTSSGYIASARSSSEGYLNYQLIHLSDSHVYVYCLQTIVSFKNNQIIRIT
jgi:hypothetical protein